MAYPRGLGRTCGPASPPRMASPSGFFPRAAAGVVTPDAVGLAAYRRRLAAETILVAADIRSMHFAWEGPPRRLADVARAARQAGADAVCLCDPDPETTLRLIDEVRSGAEY